MKKSTLILSFILTINVITAHATVKNPQVIEKIILLLFLFGSRINIYQKTMYKTETAILNHFDGCPMRKELKFKINDIRIIPAKHKLNSFIFIPSLQNRLYKNRIHFLFLGLTNSCFPALYHKVLFFSTILAGVFPVCKSKSRAAFATRPFDFLYEFSVNLRDSWPSLHSACEGACGICGFQAFRNIRHKAP